MTIRQIGQLCCLTYASDSAHSKWLYLIYFIFLLVNEANLSLIRQLIGYD